MKRHLITALVILVLLPAPAHAGFGSECRDLIKMMWGDKDEDLAMKVIGRGALLFMGGLAGGLTWLVASAVQSTIETNRVVASVTPAEIEDIKKKKLGPGEQPITELGGVRYFVRGEYILRINPDGHVESVGKGAPRSVQTYENSIVCREAGGQLSLFIPGWDRWFIFDVGAEKVLATDETIYVKKRDGSERRLARSGAFHVFSKDDGTWTLMPDGQGGTTMQYVPDTKYYLRDNYGHDVTFVPADLPTERPKP